jgi:adenylate cyclase
VLIYSFLRELEGRRALFRTFSLYLPPDRARQLARQPAGQAMAAENRELSVLFCDLRGFTNLSESLAPDALRELLNAYFSRATEVVHAHGGTLDKFIGDAVMAFWGAPQAQPDHARRAVKAALALANSADPLNAQLAARGLPPVRFGIGVATGVVCVGDLGSRLRRSYTAVGDAVNLAARLEALTREAGVALLVDEPTRTACGDAGSPWVWVEVDRCPIRGRQQAVTVFTPLPTTADSAPMLEAQVRNWHLAQALARQHHTEQALAELAPLLSPAPTTILPAASTSPALAALATHLARQLGHDAEGAPCTRP